MPSPRGASLGKAKPHLAVAEHYASWQCPCRASPHKTELCRCHAKPCHMMPSLRVALYGIAMQCFRSAQPDATPKSGTVPCRRSATLRNTTPRLRFACRDHASSRPAFAMLCHAMQNRTAPPRHFTCLRHAFASPIYATPRPRDTYLCNATAMPRRTLPPLSRLRFTLRAALYQTCPIPVKQSHRQTRLCCL